MSNIKSAKKKARKDIKRTKANNIYLNKIDMLLNRSLKSDAENKVEPSKAYSVIDKALKRKILSKKKAAKIKSKIASVKA